MNDRQAALHDPGDRAEEACRAGPAARDAAGGAVVAPGPRDAVRSQPSTPKLLGLEGLRGLLALLVCAGHYGLNDLGARLGFQVRFDAAVDVFFAISGFVMSRAYYFGRRSFRDLVASRIARLYPLHLLTLLWCVALAGSLDWPLLMQNLLLVQNVGLPPNRWSYNFPSWSISVEMAVSLALWLVLRRGRPLLAVTLVTLGVALAAFELASGLTPALNHSLDSWAIFNSGLMRGIAGFALGAAAYLVTLHAPQACARLRPAALPLALLLFALFFRETWSWPASLLFALTVFATVLAVAAADHVPLLSSRPLVWLGAVSYSLYLLHIPVAFSASALLGTDIDGAGVVPLLAVVLAASAVSYRWIELPMQRWLLVRLGRSPPA